MGRRVSVSLAVLSALTVVCAATSARAQGVDGRRTGVFFRPAYALSVFNADTVRFTAQRPRPSLPDAARGFSGKDLGWDRMAFSGVSLGLEVDASLFYVRVGADLMQSPSVSIGADRYHARFTTVGWLDAGPRVRVGPVMLQAGARVGALLMNVTSAADGVEYSAVHALFGLQVGAQWRPLRWLQVDAAVSQDFSARLATTVTVGASFGWSASGR